MRIVLVCLPYIFVASYSLRIKQSVFVNVVPLELEAMSFVPERLTTINS